MESNNKGFNEITAADIIPDDIKPDDNIERFEAYEGRKPYIFVSYSHADSGIVIPIITRLHEEGYRIWYDQGIAPVSNFSEVIFSHLKRCSVFMIFITESSVTREFVINELHAACDRRKKIFVIKLDDAIPPGDVALRVAAYEQLIRKNHTPKSFETELRRPLGKCKEMKGGKGGKGGGCFGKFLKGVGITLAAVALLAAAAFGVLKALPEIGGQFAEYDSYGIPTPTPEGYYTYPEGDIEVSESLTFKKNDDETGYIVSALAEDCEADIIIPREYRGLPVVSIASQVFCKNSKIVSVTIPDTVTLISKQNFAACPALEKVIIPDSVTKIHNVCFYNCESLYELRLPSQLVDIEDKSFMMCPSLRTIYVDENNPYFCSYNGVLYTKDRTVLVRYPGGKPDSEFTLPAGVNYVLPSAFSKAPHLNSIGVEEENQMYLSKSGVLLSGDGHTLCAYPSGRLNDSYDIPDGVTTIGSDSFIDSQNLKKLNITDGVKTVNEYSLFNSSIETVDMADSVVSLGEYAFCLSSLTQIRLSENLESLPSGVFKRCGSLKSIVVPDRVASIENETFQDCTSLENLTLPEGITSIPANMCQGCSMLKELTIPESVTDIKSSAFAGCKSLKSIEIPKSVTAIGKEVFKDCNITVYAPKPADFYGYEPDEGVTWIKK